MVNEAGFQEFRLKIGHGTINPFLEIQNLPLQGGNIKIKGGSMKKILMGLTEFAGISANKYLKKERVFGNQAIAPDATLCSDNLYLLTKHFPC